LTGPVASIEDAAMTHVALLRAVNLAGHNKVGMADLRAWLESLGFTNVRSLLQSGNLLFDGPGRGGALEAKLEISARQDLDLQTDFHIRTGPELRGVIDANPFSAEAKADPSHLVVVFLRDAPEKKHLAALRAAITGRETIALGGRHAYIVYPDGIGRSKLTARLIERKLETTGTGRNWNTVLKLAALAGV
jgi:uncharacterized protein (DUF1697 family)